MHCRIWRKSPPPEIDAELLCQAARDVAAWLGPVEVQIAGGEPLLSPNLLPLVRCASEAGLAVTLTTNGFALEGEVARQLAHAGLQIVTLSLDGFDHVHNRLRGRDDAFALAQRAIAHAHDNGLRVRINCVICALNLEILQGFVTWLNDDPRVEGIVFQAFVQPFGQAPRERWWENEPLFPRDAARTRAVLTELLHMKRAGFPILNPDPQFAAMIDYFADPGRFALRRCSVGQFGLTIEGAGFVRLCGRHDAIGNLGRGERLIDIVTGAKAEAVRAKMQQCRENCHLLINCCFDEDAR
jgi:MoaA/NifB/PqqE/SkfB family radical SAM enzyme